MSIDQYSGDVALILGADGGDIVYIGGQPVMDAGGLENAVNISLFTGGGWWGNVLFENEPDLKYGSDFEETLRPNAVSSKYLRAVEESAKAALQWLINKKIARRITVDAAWPELNTVNVNILIEKMSGENVRLKYDLSWEHGFLYPVTAKVE